MTAATKTRSQLAKLSREKGVKAERDLCAWLRPWWPDVDRTQRTGYRTALRQRKDNGDIAGTPGIIWSVKDAERHYIAHWWTELVNMQLEHPLPQWAPVPIRLLVVKNAGHANPGEWWCWMPLYQLAALATGNLDAELVLASQAGYDLVRCHLQTAVTRLRACGYGLPLEPAA